jgi:TolB-like protein
MGFGFRAAAAKILGQADGSVSVGQIPIQHQSLLALADTTSGCPVCEHLDDTEYHMGHGVLRGHGQRLGQGSLGSRKAGVAVVGQSAALPDKPSIAVLPFTNMSGDPEQDYFADGMVEDIITALSRFKELFVIARNSSFTYKGRAVDVKQVGHELGVRYVLEGSVRKAANRVRITGQLVDTATGAHLWANRFDGGLGDIFDLQDQVAESVVGAIAPAVEKAEIERAKRKPTESLDAYALYLRGLAKLYQFANRQANDEALRLFNSAIELDPDFASAYGRAAFCYANAKGSGWISETTNDIAEVTRLAQRAVGQVRARFGQPPYWQ